MPVLKDIGNLNFYISGLWYCQIVHIRGRGAAGYWPVNSVWGAADNLPVNSSRDVPLAYTAKPFVTRAVSLRSI